MNPSPEIKAELERMLDELESAQLVVILVPQRRHTNTGGMVRVAVEKNVLWYRQFCARFPSTRVRRNAAPDTKIKRANVRAVLAALIAGCTRSSYAPALLGLARRRAESAVSGWARVGGAR